MVKLDGANHCLCMPWRRPVAELRAERNLSARFLKLLESKVAQGWADDFTRAEIEHLEAAIAELDRWIADKRRPKRNTPPKT